MAADLALIIRVQGEQTQLLKSLQGDLKNLEMQGGATGASFTKLASSFAVGQVAAQAFLGIVGGLASTIAGAAQSTLGLSSNLEQTRIALTGMLGSASKANEFIGQLQDFAENTNFNFPTLEEGAKRMLAMGFASKDVIPLLGDIANAVGAVGGGQEQVNRVVLALGQMQAKSKVASEEMNQLAELGIPVWKILAEAIGKTQAETIALVQSGQVASTTFINAFHKFAGEQWGDIQAQQAKTFSGAMSNVQDVIGRLSVEGFSSLFQALTVGANLLYQFLKTDQVRQWAADFNASVGAVLGALAPLGDALKQILGIGGGGQAAATAATAVAAPAQAIAATVTAGADAAKEGIKALDAEARGVQQTIHGINDQMTALNEQSAALKEKIQDTKDGFQAQLDPLKAIHEELQRAAQDAKEGFDAFLNPLKSALDDTKSKISDIKSGYDDQRNAIKDQIDAIEGVNDSLRKQEDLQNSILDAQLRAQGLAAQGDPVVRAGLQNKLDDIGFDRSHIANQIQLLELKNRHGDNDKKIAALRKEQNQLDAQAIGVREKIADLTDRTALAEVKKKEAIQAAAKAQQDIERKQEDLAKQQQTNPLKDQLKGLDKAERAALAPLEAIAKGLQQTYDRVKGQQEAALAAIEAKQRDNERAIQDTEAAQKAVLDPLEAQAKTLERQRTALQLSEQHWQGIAKHIADSKADLEAAAKAAKEAGLVAGGGGLSVGGTTPGQVLDPRDRGIVPPSANLPKSLISDETLKNLKDAATATGELAKNMGELMAVLVPVAKVLGTIALGLIIVQGFTSLGLAVAGVISWAAQFVAGMGILSSILGGVATALAGVGLGTIAVVAAIAAFVVGLGLYITNFGGFRDSVNEIFKNIWDTTVQVFKDMGTNISGAIGLMLKDTREGGSNFWPAMKGGLDTFTTNFGNWLKTQTESLGKWKDGVIAWLGDIGQSGGDLFNAFWMLGQNVLGAIKDGISGSFDWFLDQIKDHFTKDLPDYVKILLDIKSPSGVFREIGHQIVAGLQHGLMKKFPDVQAVMAKFMGGLAGGAPPGNAVEWLKKAMDITGAPKDWLPGLKDIMMMESSGRANPPIGPDVWDHGHNLGPAMGLMQMVMSTFQDNALDGMRNIFDPVNNAVSSIRYIKQRWGDPYHTPEMMGTGHWYAQGGIVPGHGPQQAVVHGGEVILNRRQQEMLLRGGGGGGTVVLNVTVQGSVTSEHDLVTTIQRGLLQLQRRNGGAGLAYR